MGEKNDQNSISKPTMFKIPIELYENDINSNFSEEEKKEIIYLLTKSHKLRYKEEFDEIRAKLHESCRQGDLGLIKIYLSETIQNGTKDITFKIDDATKTASLFKVSNNTDQIIIPRTVQHKSAEYLITSITGTNQNIKSIKFSEDSAVKTIYHDAFSGSKIKEIYFPASLKELKEGWCSRANNLTKITISPLNGQFIFQDDKYLLGKTDPNSDEFDTFLFAAHDIKEISIPSNIKKIASYSLAYYSNLTKVEIPPNSNLQIIGSNAFTCSDIKEIFIPSKVSIISKSAFQLCTKLKKVEFATNSNLQIIESNAFSSSKIKEIFIPSKVSKICENAFSRCLNLIKIEIPLNSNLQTIESNAFNDSKIEEIFIPASLKELKESCFYMANNLRKITISPFNGQFIFQDDKYLLGKIDTNSDEFDNLLFAVHDIKEISIPSNIKKISSYAFDHCSNLTKVEIPPNSNLQIIGSHAFSETKIEEIFIPSKVSIICQNAFSSCLKLTKVEIPPNSNLQIIEPSAFSYTKIKNFFVPSKVSKICQNAFANCSNLTKIEIPPNSNLQTIESLSFIGSKIEEIYFPASLRELKEAWCFGINSLSKITISPSNGQFIFQYNKYLLGKTDPNNDEFDTFLFAVRSIKEIFIPSNIKKISSYSFYYCRNLTKVEFATNSNLQIVESNAFSSSNINEIFIPSKVSKISGNAFYCCSNLKIVEISEGSKLESFPLSAFFGCPNVIFMIPSSLDKLIHINKPI